MSSVLVRRCAVAGVLVAFLAWWAWPFTRGADTDVVIVGNGSVAAATDELERRLRQEGIVTRVVVVEPAACSDIVDAAGDADSIVVSFSEWGGCTSLPSTVRLLVEQPRGELVPSSLAGDRTVRPASLLFTGGERDSCRWWDTPGAGEARPGLGQCAPDGTVAMFSGDELTPAGRERFARLVAEALQ